MVATGIRGHAQGSIFQILEIHPILEVVEKWKLTATTKSNICFAMDFGASWLRWLAGFLPGSCTGTDGIEVKYVELIFFQTERVAPSRQRSWLLKLKTNVSRSQFNVLSVNLRNGREGQRSSIDLGNGRQGLVEVRLREARVRFELSLVIIVVSREIQEPVATQVEAFVARNAMEVDS